MPDLAPTLEQFQAYQAAYEYFNDALFGAELAPCLLNFSRKQKSYGFFGAERWVKGQCVTHEISLNPDHFARPLHAIFATLVHEMCHQWQFDFGCSKSRNTYHNREWADKMLEVGLVPSDTGKVGGKQTGQSMSHYIDLDGPFAAAFLAMPEATKIPWQTMRLPSANKKTPIKYACTGHTVRGKTGLKLYCQDCDMMMAEVAAKETEPEDDDDGSEQMFT